MTKITTGIFSECLNNSSLHDLLYGLGLPHGLTVDRVDAVFDGSIITLSNGQRAAIRIEIEHESSVSTA